MAIMPRYFFHLHNDIDAPDESGREHGSDREALVHALECVRDVASASVRRGTLNLNHFVICVADDGREVGIVRFADAVQIES
jgi:hypothetical protein